MNFPNQKQPPEIKYSSATMVIRLFPFSMFFSSLPNSARFHIHTSNGKGGEKGFHMENSFLISAAVTISF
jgi:hypothetical protein